MAAKPVSKKAKKQAESSRHRALSLIERYAVPFPSQYVELPLSERAYYVGLYLKVAGEFLEPLSGERSATALDAACQAGHRTLDDLLRDAPETVEFADLGRSTLACRPGCSFCCTLRVTCTAFSALCAAKYLKKKLTSTEMKATIERIRIADRLTSTMSSTERALSGTMCPLNVDGLCSAYHARPLTCRAYHSFDLRACMADRRVSEEDALVPADGRRLRLRDAVSTAMNRAAEALGLSTDEVDFIPALRIALETPDVVERYLAGEDVFASARRHDVGEGPGPAPFQRSGFTTLPIVAG